MKILYCAIDQVVPGTKGGSVHVRAVAEGWRRSATRCTSWSQRGAGGFPPGAVHWHEMAPPLGSARLRLAQRGPRGARLARALRPDVVIERYYNFGGEGMRAAAACGALVGPRGQRAGHRLPRLAQAPARPRAARRADAALARLAVPRRRRRSSRRAGRSCRRGCPTSASSRLEWGADTDRFRPGAAGRRAVRADARHA